MPQEINSKQVERQELACDQVLITSNTTLSTKGSTSVYCYVSECFQELSYYMKHNFK